MLNSNLLRRLLLETAILVSLAVSCSDHDSQASLIIEESPTISYELSNRRITAFCEDAMGHVWIGTFRGLNKCNAHDYRQYFHSSENPASLCDNQINSIFCDSKGRLWIGTINGVSIYTDRDCFEQVTIEGGEVSINQIFDAPDERILLAAESSILEYDGSSKATPLMSFSGPSSAITCHCDASGNLWAVFNDRIEVHSLADPSITASYPLPQGVSACLFDSTWIWTIGQGRVSLFDMVSRKFKVLSPEVEHNPLLDDISVNIIHPYSGNKLLINSFENGLMLMDMSTGKIISHDEAGFPFDAPEFGIFRMFTDSQQNLWLGSYDQGVVVKNSRPEKFNADKYLQAAVKGKSVMDIKADEEGNIYIATMLDGLISYDSHTHNDKKISLPVGNFKNNSLGYSVSSIAIDAENNVWVASLITSKVFKCRRSDDSLKIIETYAIDRPLSLKCDPRGRIWVGCGTNQICCIDPSSNTVKSLSIPGDNYTFVPAICPINQDIVAVGAFKRGLYLINASTMQIEPADLPKDNWDACFNHSFFIPTCICADSFGIIWIGTVGNGLLRWSFSGHSIEKVKGSPCSDISSVEEDRQGNIWVSSQYGLSRYDRTSDKFTLYFEKDGTGGNQYYDRSSCILADGSLLFGGTHGVTSFNPMDLSGRRSVPLVFEDLKIHNNLTSPERNPEIMSRHLSYCPKITLSHRQNGFAISFAALDYSHRERPNYLFMLQGHDRYWIDARRGHEAYYANLSPGRYTFKVKITNDSNTLNESEISLPIVIKPAPWLSWWAITLYVLVIAAIGMGFTSSRKRTIKARELARRAIFEKEQEKRTNKMNMRFFSNIAHEFRTPLTMISGPLGQLEQSPAIQGADRETLSIIQRSVTRMLKLVNQLMDFNKMENDTLKLRVERSDAAAYMRKYMDIFRINAADKGIEFCQEGLDEGFICLIDTDKFDKILSNLMSNALKFTPRDGKIGISFDVVPQQEALADIASSQYNPPSALNASSYIKVCVNDSGPGIPQELSEKIFERYYQLTDADKGRYNYGTGIGLYYARALATLHHGALFLKNEPSGAPSSTFILLIPACDDVYSKDEHVEPTPKIAHEESLPIKIEAPKIEADGEGYPAILVVEDDMDVIHYLQTLLSPAYKVICAYNGEEALELAARHHPRLVISDVVMPGMDGYELCRTLKNDVQLSHIPVILVTAQAGMESQIRGLNTGADAYVPKPFDTKYLLALIRSLLDNREKLQKMLSHATEVGQVEKDGNSLLSGPDKVFMDKLYGLMEKEIATSELDIMQITRLMHISRTKFYYKMKELTGESPANFFKTYKLNRAAELIREGRYNVSEIADMTGFSTHAHFTTSFKKQFGVTPSVYAENPSKGETK